MQIDIKKMLKTVFKVKTLIIIILIVLLGVIFISGFSYIITLNDAVNANNGNTISSNNTQNNMPAQIENQITSLITSANIVYKGNGDYKLDIDLDEKINELYNQFIKTREGSRTLSYLKGTETQKKEYLKNMIRAELITQYPDFRSKEKFGTEVDSNEIQGTIQIKRIVSDTIKKVSKIEKSTNTSLDLNGIVCWGDNLTYGNPGDETNNYPTKLSEKLGKNAYNLGFYGDTAEQILLRAGVDGYVFETTEESFEIEENIGSTVTFTAQIKVDGEAIENYFSTYDGSTEDKKIKCTIGGVEGTIIYQDEKYVFTRTSQGEKTTIEKETEIKIETQKGYTECLPIIWIGNNNNSYARDPMKLVDLYKDFLASIENPDDYIIIVPIYYEGDKEYTDEEYEKIKNKLLETFNNKCLDLKTEGWSTDSGYDSLAEIIKNKISTLGFEIADTNEENPNAGQVEFDGTISVGDEITLEYIPLGNKLEPSPGTLMWLVQNENTDLNNAALQYFSIDGFGNIIVANWTRTTTKIDSNEEGVENIPEPGKIEYSLSTVKINYKTLISEYTMPFDYLWAFLVMGEDTEFVQNLTDLALDSEIEITLYDELTILENDEKETHQEQNKTYIEEYTTDIYNDGNRSFYWRKYYTDTTTEDKHKYTNIVTETNKVKYRLTKADVWCVKYEVTGVNQVYYNGKDNINADLSNPTYTIIQKDVSIESSRGTKIPAKIFLPDGVTDSIPLVIMCHGFTGKKEGDDNHFVELGSILAQNGIGAITIDFPGCGESTEPSTSYTLNNMLDYIDSAINYMKANYSINNGQIGIVGHSMGGRVASEYLDKVQAAALWAPANGDGLSGLKFLGDNYEELAQTAQSNGSVETGNWNFTVSGELFSQMSSSHPLEKIQSFAGKLLIVYGDSDDVIDSEVISQVESIAPQGTFKKYGNGSNHNLTSGDAGSNIVQDTANLFCNAFLGHDASSSNVKNGDYQQTISILPDQEWQQIGAEGPINSRSTIYKTITVHGQGATSIPIGTKDVSVFKMYYRRLINQQTITTVVTSGYTYTEGIVRTEEKTDKTVTQNEITTKEFNEPNFVKYYLYSQNAKNKISSAYGWLFEILEKNRTTVGMVDITKYMIYKATSKDLGITSFDFGAYNDSDFKDAIEYDSTNPGANSEVSGGTGDTNLEVSQGNGYWGIFTNSFGASYKLYYQNYYPTGVKGDEWGTGSSGLCLATAYAIANSGYGDTRTPNNYWGSNGAVGKYKKISSSEVAKNLSQGIPVILFGSYGGKYYDNPTHALVLLDISSDGSQVYMVNPYHGNNENKNAGLKTLAEMTSYNVSFRAIER